MKKISFVIFVVLVCLTTILMTSCGNADEKAMEPIDELLAEIPEEEILANVGTHDISEEVAFVKAEAEKIGAEYSVTIVDKDGNVVEMNEQTFVVEEGQRYTITLFIKLNKVERTKAVILRAAETFTVTFDLNGGTGAGEIPYVQQIIEEDDATLPTPPTKEGYIFDGWNPEPVLNDITLNATYIATWIETYEITFNSNGGSAVSAISVYTGENRTMPASQRDNYYFAGWYVDENLTTPFSLATVSSDVLLYADWELYLGTPTYNAQLIPEEAGSYNTYLFEYPASSGDLNMSLLVVGSPDEKEYTYIKGNDPDMSTGYGELGITVKEGDEEIGVITIFFHATE